MKKGIFVLIFSISLVFTPQKSDAFLGNVGRAFCEKVQQLGPILNSFTVVQWPVVGFPGITMGLAQNTSVILDLCNLVMQIEQLSTQDAIFFAAGELNKMTDNRWGHHLDFADKTWNLANSIYDFEAGETRRGAFQSRATYREMNDFMGASYSWYHKTVNGKDARLKNRREREQDMAQYSRVAYRRAILQEATNCPTPVDNQNYSQIYESKIAPEELKIEDFREDVDFFRGQLMKMGPRFMNNEQEMKEYTADVEQLMTAGVSYQIRTRVKNETTYKPDGVDAQGNAKHRKVTLKRDTQVWTARLFSDLFQQFRDRWGQQWYDWVKAEYLSRGTRGILNDPRGKVESEFVDLAFECNSSRLMRGVPLDRQDYNREQERRVELCKTQVQTNQKKSEGLLNYYVNNLSTSLFQLKKSRATIYTAESYYLGRNRTLDISKVDEGFQQENITCQEKLEPAEMQKLSLKQQAVENEYNEMISMQVMKQTVLMEQEKKAEAESLDEVRRRRNFAERKVQNGQRDLKDSAGVTPYEGGL